MKCTFTDAAAKEILDTIVQRFISVHGYDLEKKETACNITFLCKPSDFIIEHEYDPNNWNDADKVIPPEGVWMRCELIMFSSNEPFRTGLLFKDGKWVYECGEDASRYGKVLRFRPWDS